MKNKMKMLLKNESGVTALETAIILIAFVVVAAVFAFTILSAGTYSTEQSREAIYAGLAEVQGSIELRGGVVGQGGTLTSYTPCSYTRAISQVVFTIANVAGGEPVDLITPTLDAATGLASSSSSHRVVIDYRDSRVLKQDLYWTLSWIGAHDSDNLLESSELAELTVNLMLPLTCTNALTTNIAFGVEVKPPSGSPLLIERTSPAYIDTINDLH